MNWKWPRQLELVERVGKGWLGEIYRARDPESPRQVYTRVLGDEALPALAPLTALLLFHATSPHPHVLPTTLPEVSGANTFYSMQPAERGSLRTLVEGHRAAGGLPDPLTALDLLRQAAEALAFAHAQGTLHGNLKPENVLLQPGRTLLGREGFHVLLADFGLNTLRPPQGGAYLSPRQRGGEPGDAADDLYGLGALLFFALCGQDPPPAPTPDALHALPLEQRPLVARALGILPPFADVPALLEEVSRLLAGAGATAPPAVTLHPEQGRLRLVPGEVATARVRLKTQVPLSAALLVEGLPPEWVTLPPAVQLQGGQEVTLPLSLHVPRHSEARSGEREVRLLLVRGRAGGTGAGGVGELLAQATLAAEVLPFHAGTLSLHAPPGTVGRRVRLELDLTNTGNHPQRYDVQAQLPPGARLTGPPPASLTLAPGERTRAVLDVRLPGAMLRGRRREVAVLAQGLGREVAAVPGSAGGPLRAGATLRQRPAVPGWASAALAGALALGAWQAARPPSIGAFTAQAAGTVPISGEPLTLTWDTAGAREVSLRELPGRALTPSGALELPAPRGTSTYTLQARGWLRSAQRTVTVRPRPPAPGITTLSVTPTSAAYGEPVTVRWEVQDAPPGKRLTLRPLGEVPARGQRTLPLTRDLTFVLTVPASEAGAARRGEVSATLRPPAVTRLTVTPGRARPGQAVTVAWEVSGARQVRVSGLGTLPARGQRTLTVPGDARAPLRLVLRASNGQREVTAAAEVGLDLPQPVITAFRVVPETPVIGQPVKVFWRTTGAEEVELRWGAGQRRLPARGQFTLTATAGLRDLSLQAQAEGRASAERRLTLTPRAPAPPTPAPRTAAQAPAPRTPSPATTPPAPAARTAANPEAAPTVTGPPRAAPPREPVREPAPPAPPRPSAARSPAAQPPAAQSPATQPPAPTAPPPATRATPPQAPAVRVLGFRSETAAPQVGAPLTVRWNVRGAQQVVLSNGAGVRIGVYPARGSATLRPREAGPLRLVLGVPGNPRPLTDLSLTVRPVPTPAPVAATAAEAPAPVRPANTVKVLGFRSETRTPRVGVPLTVRWNVRGTSQVVLSNGEGGRIGVYPAQGSATLRPREAGPFRLVLGVPGSPRPLTDLSLTVGRREDTPPAPSPRPAPTPAVSVLDFRAAPARLQPGQATTLVWRVTGVDRVLITGLSGPGPGGSFPPAYAVLTPRLSRSATYTLRAGNVRRTVRVPVSGDPIGGAATSGSPGSDAAPAPSPYRALAGTWTHSQGELDLQVTGNRVTGTLSSSGGGLPSGTLRGTFQGSPEGASFNGYLSGGGRQVAVVLRFTGTAAFEGVYAGEGRQAWCGWRGPAPTRC